MKTTRSYARHLGICLVAALVAFVAVPASMAQLGESRACTLLIHPGAIAVGAGNVVISVEASRAVGTNAKVEVDTESGISITEIRRTESPSIEVHLDTTAAAPGTWSISVHGDAASCDGSLIVEAGHG